MDTIMRGSDEQTVVQLLHEAQAGTSMDVFKLARLLYTVPLRYQLKILDVMFAPFRQTVPTTPIPCPQTSAAMLAVEESLGLIATSVDPYQAINDDKTGVLKRYIEDIWPNIVLWLQFFTKDPRMTWMWKQDGEEFSQPLLVSITQLLCSMYAVDTTRKFIEDDLAILRIVLFFYLKQKPRDLFALEAAGGIDFWVCFSPSFMLFRVINARTPQDAYSKGEQIEALQALNGHEIAITDLALRNLSLIIRMSPTLITELCTVDKFNIYLNLLDSLTKLVGYADQLRKPRTIKTVMKTLRLLVSSKNAGTINPPANSKDAETFSLACRTGLNIIIHFLLDQHADQNIKIFLRHGLGDVYAAVTRWLTDCPTMNGAESLLRFVRSINIRLSLYTMYRTVVQVIAKSTESAFTSRDTPRLEDNEELGKHWTTLRCLALERVIYRYLFDQAFKRNGIQSDTQCVHCRETFPSDIVKRCGGCKIASYCSERCQQQSWDSKHRASCKTLTELNRDEITGKRDIAFIQVVATRDIYRHIPALLNLIKCKYPSLTLTQLVLHIDYSARSCSPIVTVTELGNDALNIVEKVWESMPWSSDSVGDSVGIKPSCLYAEAIVALGKKSFPLMLPIQVKELMQVLANNSDQFFNKHENEGNPFKRSKLRLADGAPLDALRDDVDDILQEFWHLTQSNPDWSIWKRIKSAVKSVEKSARERGRDIYRAWY